MNITLYQNLFLMIQNLICKKLKELEFLFGVIHFHIHSRATPSLPSKSISKHVWLRNLSILSLSLFLSISTVEIFICLYWTHLLLNNDDYELWCKIKYFFCDFVNIMNVLSFKSYLCFFCSMALDRNISWIIFSVWFLLLTLVQYILLFMIPMR